MCPAFRWSIAVLGMLLTSPCRRSMHPLLHAPRSVRAYTITLAVLVVGCGGATDTPVTPPAALPPPALTGTPVLTRVVVVSGLSNPWDVAILPDGSLLYTERCRGVSLRRTDGSTVRLFGTTGSTLVAPDLVCEGQSGVLGVALDPAFATNRRAYVYLASGQTSAQRTNRVLRLELAPDLSRAVAREDLITDIPYKQVANGVGGAGVHSGGRIRFGPDGWLYVTTGDNHNALLPQHPTQLGGKVLRVTSDGRAAPGNGAPSGFDPRIFSYGHRNVQGISFHPESREAWVAEHGPNHSDEVTRLVAGGNAGWDPQNRPTLSCPSGYCGYAGNATTMPMTDLNRFPAAIAPAWTNSGLSQGVGPAEFLVGSAWRDWNGRLAVGVMRSQQLVVLTVGATGTVSGSVTAGLPAVRYRGLTLGPGGVLYVVTDAGEIWTLTPGG